MNDIGELLLGSLVLDKNKTITQVKSLNLEKIRASKYSIGQRYFGQINGEPAKNFDDCPVTISILRKLGWHIDDEVSGVVTAWPEEGQFDDPRKPEELMVYFVLADDAMDGCGAGDVLVRSVNIYHNDYLVLFSMVHLEWLFCESFSQRMKIDIHGWEEVLT